MRNLFFIFHFAFFILLAACSKPDPILPGQRDPIFASDAPVVLNREITDLPDTAKQTTGGECPYTQDSSNAIHGGDKKIFSGFATSNFVKAEHKPACHGGFVYAGLTTGELVKINPRTRNVEWIADIYRPSNMTGGAAVTDIVAPLALDAGYVYAAGLGHAFCKVRISDGKKSWCANIAVGVPFVLAGNFAFVVSTDNMLYAINTANGDIYWGAQVARQAAPIYADKIITVGRERFNAATGK